MAYANTIETSTTCIDYFVYSGTYETLVGEYLSVVTPNDRDAAETAVADLALSIIGEAFWDNLPSDVQNDFELVYSHTYHPRYYNFETDSIVFNFNYSDELKNWFFDYATENKDKFDKFLHKNFTSRSGFISYTPNNWSDWLDGWNETEWRCVSALLNFFINNWIGAYDRENYEYGFRESLVELIEQDYIHWQYAEKYENGWVGVCKSDYDYDEDATIFTAWLLDEDGNVIDTATIDDPYDDSFHGSAYAAWEYGDLGWDLTKDRVENRWKAVQCPVPEIPETMSA